MPSSLSYVPTVAGVRDRLSDGQGDDSCVHVDALLKAFRRHIDRIALIRDDGPMTYADLLDEMFRLARALDSRGLSRGTGIAAIDDNTTGVVLTWLASKLLGCYFVSVPADAAPAEQAEMIEFTEVSAVVYEPASFGRRAVDLAAHGVFPTLLSFGPGPVGTDLRALAAVQSSMPFRPRARESDLADLVFTSGSTGGQPKAAAYTYQRLGELGAAWQMVMGRDTAEAAAYRAPDCRLLRPFRAIASPGVAVLPTLLCGGALLLQQGFDAGAVLRAVERHRITAMVVYPSQLYQLLDHPDIARTDHSSLRLLIYSGAPMSPTRLNQAIAVFGPVLCQVYGQSETRMISGLRPEEHRQDRPELLRSVGRPYPGVDVEVRTNTGIAAAGEVGEIRIRSPYRMNYYWREPHLSAETIVDDWCWTGDLGYQDTEGYLYLVDRRRNTVLVNGISCYTVDIENALTAHPAVRAAIAVGLPDAQTGEAVHVAVVRHAHIEVSEDELREFVRSELGESQTPRTVLFLDDIPATRSGKPDKNAIRDLVSKRQRSSPHR